MLPFENDCRYLIFHPVLIVIAVKWQMATRKIVLETMRPHVVVVYGHKD
jgi:hypothetical protein